MASARESEAVDVARERDLDFEKRVAETRVSEGFVDGFNQLALYRQAVDYYQRLLEPAARTSKGGKLEFTTRGQSYTIQFFYGGHYERRRVVRADIETILSDGETYLVARGIAHCSRRDEIEGRYNRQYGRKLALKRALESVFDRDQRREIWNQLFEAGLKQ